MKNQVTMSFTKITNPIIMEPNENNLNKIPDKEFKRGVINMLKAFKEDTDKHSLCFCFNSW